MGKRLVIKIDMDNAAFDDGGSGNAGYQVAQILKRLAQTCEDYGLPLPGTLMDVNGNTCGELDIVTTRTRS